MPGDFNVGPIRILIMPLEGAYTWFVYGWDSGTEPTPEAARRAALQAAVRLLRGWLGEAERALGEQVIPAGGAGPVPVPSVAG